MRNCFVGIAIGCSVLMGLFSCGQMSEREHLAVDSLNTLAHEAAYRSLDDAMGYVDEVLGTYGASNYTDGMHEAWLIRGDVYGMKMDYDSARVCYQKVLSESNNDLICGMADVDMMSVCLMLSLSKEFYDYRNDALERFTNVEDELADMTEHQERLWNTAQAEYHFVSLNYFLKMRQDEGMMEEYNWLEEHQSMYEADSTQLAAFLFLRSLFSMKEVPDAEEETQRNLTRLLSLGRSHGYDYFEASALNSLASAMLSGAEMRPSRRVFVSELVGEDDYSGYEEDWVWWLAEKARQKAHRYGNAFAETTALVTLSNYYLQQGEDSLALAQMEQALHLINAHHRTMCEHLGEKNVKADSLRLYDEDGEYLSTEMRWIANPSIVAVPEWMAMVREQLSVVYGAMGLKAESDYNHNVYFDILDATRQDLRVQQEEAHLKQEERTLNLLLGVLVVMVIAVAWGLLVYNRRSRETYLRKVSLLRKVIEVCQSMSEVLSNGFEDEEDLISALHNVSDQQVRLLFPQIKEQEWTCVDMEGMKGLDGELFRVMRVFYDWMYEKGLQYLQFSQEQQQVESETYGLEKRLEENKRQYVEKLTSMSIVNGITPFLDRARHEVQRLETEVSAQTNVVQQRERLTYLNELVEKINEYNEVLGHWVKIRQGLVVLNIDNFALQPLFETLRKGAKSFSLKGVKLTVNDTASVVKADKALTLFMMNTLLDNARKYTPEGGQVTLQATETEDYVEVSVRDTGYGMSEEDVQLLLHNKVYASEKIGVDGTHAAEVKQNKGFGFGLMNCKGIIGRYQKTNSIFSVCHFGVESKLGQGSRFFFRLPKGVLRVLTLLLLFIMNIGVQASTQLASAEMYVDSVYACNVRGDYGGAVLYADSAIQRLNYDFRLQMPHQHSEMHLESGPMGELEWWKLHAKMNYELIIRLRNEVAIAALSLPHNALYRYNCEVLTRLYKLTSTDPTLEEYCNDIRLANQNKKTTVILLGMLMVLVLIIYFFLHYRNSLLFIFNLRQFIQLNKAVFTAAEPALPEVLHRSLSDIKLADTVGMLIPQEGEEEPFRCGFTGDTLERGVYEAMMQSAYRQRAEVVSDNGHFHAYPLQMPGMEDEAPLGVMGVRFSNGHLTDEEKLIMRLVVQFMSIHAYFSHYKMEEMGEILELKKDERLRMENEQQKVYVRNQIMDNSLSTLKHETMYYPHRIKQIVDAALQQEGALESKTINDINELLTYYQDVFSILSSCASKQVEQVLFKRTLLSSHDIVQLVERSFRRLQKRAACKTALRVSTAEELRVQGDKIFLQTLIDNIVSLYFEHQSGGDLLLDFDVSDGFAKFAFTDTAFHYSDEELATLFYVDGVTYDTKTDTLRGTQYLVCRQIIREHDAYASRRGCRIYVENCPEGRGARFVFTLPVA